MKKLLCLCMAVISVLMCFAGCTKPAETTPTTTVAATQSPEEEAVLKVLLIGQSLGNDTIWLLYDVLRAEMPDREFVVGNVYESIYLAQHRQNIENETPAYKYYKFADDRNKYYEALCANFEKHIETNGEFDLV